MKIQIPHPHLLLLLLLPFTSIAQTVVDITDPDTTTDIINFTDCSLDDYYVVFSGSDPDANTWDLDQLKQYTIQQHRFVLENINSVAGLDDVYQAMIDLDRGTVPNSVHLLYRDIDFNATPAGNQNTWKKHDTWPQLRGAFIGTKAFTDIHGKLPADSSVLLAKRDLFFGECGTVEDNALCRRPATSETAPTSEQDRKIFAPPLNSRGKVARAVLYQALRYETELRFQLSDCPPFSRTEFGYKSQLLRWHRQEPPTDAERDRNQRACSRWQGNRNPFVDFPELAERYFGQEDSIIPGTTQYSACADPTLAPTATPNACSSLEAGDVPVFIANSDSPDSVLFYTLADLPEELESIFITDRPWDGTKFVGTEGTLEFKIPAGGLQAGSNFGYGSKDIPFFDQWVEDEEEEKKFELGTDGDQLFVYCIDADGLENILWGYNFNDEWAEPGLTAEAYGTNRSSLPDALSEMGSVVLPHKDNCKYDGALGGFKDDILAGFMDPLNYNCSDDNRFAVDTSFAISRTTVVGVCITVIAMVVGWM